MKTIFSTALLLLAGSIALSAQPKTKTYQLASPDGRIQVTIQDGAQLNYAVSLNGQPVLAPTPISITLDSVTLGQPAMVQKTRIRNERSLLPVPIPVKIDTIQDWYNELRLEMKSNCAVVFRAYNTGVAYRWETSLNKPEVLVKKEVVTVNFAGDCHFFFPKESSFFSHQEPAFVYLSAAETKNDALASLPVVVKMNSGVNLFLAESDVEEYPGLWFQGTGGNGLQGTHPAYPLKEELKRDRDLTVTQRADFIARTRGTRTFPWRILGIAENDGDLLTNTLVYQLAKPCALTDISWIKPGKVAWDWWNANNVYGVDFPSGVNTATYKYYIDFAAKNGLDYIILDEGWYELGDVLKLNPDIDMEALARYAKEKNVGLILWVVWNTLDDKLEQALTQFEKWGVKGIKVDFMQRDDQVVMGYYHRVTQAAAKHHLLVDYHGNNRPILLARTYPNLITTEGIRGLEWCKWSDSTNPEHDATIPFTRMLLGPMDYTPGAMVNVKKENFHAVFEQPMSMGTRCHQLALYVIFESPLQMLADNPSNYAREPECLEFLTKVPVTWDQTEVLDARIGDYILMARRKGNEWYIGGLTDWSGRELVLDCSFLPAGSYKLVAWQDGVNATRHGSDYKKVEQVITNSSRINIRLAPGGGYAARIIPL